MEVHGVVSRQTPLCFSSSSSLSCPSKELQHSSGSVVMQRRRRVAGEIATSTGFYDQGHLRYYSSNPVAIVKGEKQEKIAMDKGLKKLKMKKKQHMKLLKGLSRDLTTFSQIGFGLDSDAGLVDQDKGSLISEATELLLEQLQKLRAEEKELKRRRKEEKARLKATRMQNRLMGHEPSSSSSSESSSDSECGEVIDMNRLNQAQTNAIAHPPAIEEEISNPTTPIIPIFPLSRPIASETTEFPVLARNGHCSEAGTSCISLSDKSGNSFDMKIEVCMGGKCKKSGAVELLDKFRGVVGTEGTVSGCKCMGKCRDGPNVKVLNGIDGDKSVRAPSNPLCIGVGLEDVDIILANFGKIPKTTP